MPFYTSKVISFSYQQDEEPQRKFDFLFSESFVLNEKVFEKLEKYDWIKLYKITPTTYVFLYKGNDSPEESIPLVKKRFKDNIVKIQKVEKYEFYQTNEPTTNLFQTRTGLVQIFEKSNLVCDKYYGMGVEDAWSRGYSGKGVVVAVNDVGVNTDLKDLEQNIDVELSFNFYHDTADVKPESFSFYEDVSLTDHGNRCSSVIAAVKGNEICSAGIAFNAKVVAFKIFEVSQFNNGLFKSKSSSDVTARSFVNKSEIVNIYSNSWGPERPFMKLNVDQEEALKFSSRKGRQGLGSLQIFPVGAVGNEFANNENTITVSAVGQNGTIPSDSVVSSSVLTSGLRNGNNLTADSMVTTSYKNKCITSFEGVSAATAQVAGILALALEANPCLTFADVQDLIVHSSEVSCLHSDNITVNAAGHKFHPVFGFGILNASKLVTNANADEMLKGLAFSAQTVNETTSCYDEAQGYTSEFCYSCTNSSDCLDVIKTVKIQVRYRTYANQIRITLVSPSMTESVLQDFKSESVKTDTNEDREQVLTSVHFWDEPAVGMWTFRIHSNGKTDVTESVSLVLFGTISRFPANVAYANSTECEITCESHTNVSNHKFNFIPIVISILYLRLF